jgi:hypothetical protein
MKLKTILKILSKIEKIIECIEKLQEIILAIAF